MLPLVPVATIHQLATAHHPQTDMTRRPTTTDPDHLYTPDSLAPDPIFMGLRSLLALGPVGRLLARFEAYREARKDRLIAAERPVEAANQTVTSRNQPPSTIAEPERADHDLAA